MKGTGGEGRHSVAGDRTEATQPKTGRNMGKSYLSYSQVVLI